MADYSELKRKAQEIKDEVKAGANTANRVGLALEEAVKALEAENKRAEQAEENLENAVQLLQDNTEDLQSIRDEVERLGNDKADKSALEATNKEVSKKQNKLDNYKEDPSNGSVEIFAQDKVSVRNDSQGGVSCVEVYNEEDTEGIIPVARMSADKENGDYASVTVRGNEVHIDGDAVKVNGVDLENVGVTIVNDLTTGGADKALSAEMGKVLGLSVEDLKERIYDLGDFGRSSQAEAEAGKADIAGNPGIVLIRYTVDNKNGIILQQVGETITNQMLFWDGVQYQRHINFDNSDKTSVSSTSSWWKMGATHTAYDAETRRLHLQDMNFNDLNPSVDAVFPLASEEEDGLMSKEQAAKLSGAASSEDLMRVIEDHMNDGVELLKNGNIKLTLKGTTKEFMPATPSGDPMHYAYEVAGANYNATTNFIVKDAPWKDMVDTIEDKAKWGFDVVDASQVKQMTIGGTTYNYVQTTRQSPEGTTEPRYFLVGQASDGTWVEDETKVLHLPGYWYLNGLGDITNAEMRRTHNTHTVFATIERGLQDTKARTLIFNELRAQIILGTISIYSSELISIIGPNKGVIITPLYFDTFLDNSTKYCYTLNWGSRTNSIYSPISAKSQARVFYLKNIPNSIKVLSKYLSKSSIMYMVDNVAPTTAITITLHADRYSQLSEDADIVAALEAKNAALEGTGGSISLVSA